MNKMDNDQTISKLVDGGAKVLILSLILFLSKNTLLIIFGILVWVIFAIIFVLISMKQEKEPENKIH